MYLRDDLALLLASERACAEIMTEINARIVLASRA
jgi:hypothetical protein